MHNFIKTILAIGACGLNVQPVAAESLPAPVGPVILTVSGEIGRTNGDGVAVFDLEMLRALGESEIVTETIWTIGDVQFTGLSLATLLDYLDAEGSIIAATAVNDYRIEIPASDATQDGPILAYEMNGEVMSRRDKGPLWLVYPFSQSIEFRTEIIYARSIWQLERMVVEE